MFLQGWCTAPNTHGLYYRYRDRPPTFGAIRRKVPKEYVILMARYGKRVRTHNSEYVERALEYTAVLVPEDN